MPHLEVFLIAGAGWQRDVKIGLLQDCRKALLGAVHGEGEHAGVIRKDGCRAIACMHTACTMDTLWEE